MKNALNKVIITFVSIGILLISFSSCKVEEVEPKVATTIELESGSDGQTAKVNADLPNPIVVLVKDQDGNVLKDISVTFSVSEGTVSEATVKTDDSGRAIVNWTLGSTAGSQTLETSMIKSDGSKAIITAMANANPIIGSFYQGGVVFWIDPTDDSKGLICAVSDQSTSGVVWGCKGTTIGGTSLDLGTGQANTAAIIAGCSESGIAARLCDELNLNGYTDWFLPSKDELGEMVSNKAAINATASTNGGSDFSGLEYYLTSSENGNDFIYVYHFSQGYSVWGAKDDDTSPFRAIRAF